jgi:hypothetical protein
VKDPLKRTQKVKGCPSNDAKGIITTNLERTAVFGNDRFVNQVGLNLISQHIKLREKTIEYAFFSPFTNL